LLCCLLFYKQQIMLLSLKSKEAIN